MKLLHIILVLILIVYLEQRLTIFYGELHHHCARPENITVPHDVLSVDLGEDPPILLPPVQRLVMRPHPLLHRPLLCRTPHILGILDFVGVSNVPLVGRDLLPPVQKLMQNFVKYFDINVLTHRVGTLDPHQVSPQDTHAQVVAEGGFPRIFVGLECIPFYRRPLLGDMEVSPINCHETVLRTSPFF